MFAAAFAAEKAFAGTSMGAAAELFETLRVAEYLCSEQGVSNLKEGDTASVLAAGVTGLRLAGALGSGLGTVGRVAGRAASSTGGWGQLAAAAVVVGAVAIKENQRMNEQRAVRRQAAAQQQEQGRPSPPPHELGGNEPMPELPSPPTNAAWEKGGGGERKSAGRRTAASAPPSAAVDQHDPALPVDGRVFMLVNAESHRKVYAGSQASDGELVSSRHHPHPTPHHRQC